MYQGFNRRARTVVVVVGLGAFGPALAGTVDFGTVIVDLDGKAIPAGTGGKELTLQTIAEIALLDNPDGGEAPRNQIPGLEDKVRRFNLAVEIHRGGKIDLGADDVVLLKAVVLKHWPPLLAGRALEIIEPPKAVANGTK